MNMKMALLELRINIEFEGNWRDPGMYGM